MALRLQLDGRKWHKVKAFLASERGVGRPARDDRKFIEAVLWFRRTGVPWRDLPEVFGPWKTVFNRFDRWAKKGKWDRLWQAMQTDVDDEWHSIDSTINRAHQHAAGGKGGLRSRPSVGRAEDCRPKFTSSLMRSGFRSPSRSPKDSDTISRLHRPW
jgi:transposase